MEKTAAQGHIAGECRVINEAHQREGWQAGNTIGDIQNES